MKGIQAKNGRPDKRSFSAALCNAYAARVLSALPSFNISEYTASATTGPSPSYIDHMVAMTLRYPASIIPAARWTASSASLASPAAVWHAERGFNLYTARASGPEGR